MIYAFFYTRTMVTHGVDKIVAVAIIKANKQNFLMSKLTKIKNKYSK